MRPGNMLPTGPDRQPISERALALLLSESELAAASERCAAREAELAAALHVTDDPYAERRPGEEHVPDAYWRLVLEDVDRGEDYRAPVPREDGSE